MRKRSFVAGGVALAAGSCLFAAAQTATVPPPAAPNHETLGLLRGVHSLPAGAVYPITETVNWRDRRLSLAGNGAVIECRLPETGGVCIDLTDSDDTTIEGLTIRVTGNPPAAVVVLARSRPSTNANFISLREVAVEGPVAGKTARLDVGGTAFLVYGAEFWAMERCKARVEGVRVAGRRVLHADLAIRSPHGPIAEGGGVSQVLGHSVHCTWTVFGDDSICNEWGRGVASIQSHDNCSLQGGLYADVVGGPGGITATHRLRLSGLREGNPNAAMRPATAGVYINGPANAIDISGLYVKGAEPPTAGAGAGFGRRVAARNEAWLSAVAE